MRRGRSVTGSGSVSECDDLVRIVSPHLAVVQVERVRCAGGVVRIAARTRELRVACPNCGHESLRVHSRYARTLADVAIGGRPVLISLPKGPRSVRGMNRARRRPDGRT